MRSDAPAVSAVGGTGYISATSNDVTPPSAAWDSNEWDVGSSRASPNCMQPEERGRRRVRQCLAGLWRPRPLGARRTQDHAGHGQPAVAPEGHAVARGALRRRALAAVGVGDGSAAAGQAWSGVAMHRHAREKACGGRRRPCRVRAQTVDGAAAPSVATAS